MERRFILGLAILFLVLAFSVGVAVGMKAIHAPGEEALQKAAQLALDDKLEQAIPLAEEVYRRWQRFQGLTAAFADHTPMDELDGLFAELMVFLNNRESPHFASTCARLSLLARAMADSHGVQWWDLL